LAVNEHATPVGKAIVLFKIQVDSGTLVGNRMCNLVPVILGSGSSRIQFLALRHCLVAKYKASAKGYPHCPEVTAY
jgi:hypothetical protein